MWNSTVTNVGIALLAQWGQGGTLTIDGAKAGTGTVATSQLMAQTNVAGDVHNLSIVKTAEITNGVKYTVQLQAAQSAYIAMQIGIWAHLNSGSSVLIAIYQAEEGNGISVPSTFDMPDFAVRFFAAVEQDNTGDYTATIDTSALVTQGQLDEGLSEKIDIADIINNLTSTATNKPLSAAQGKALDEAKVNIADIVDNLTSTATDKPLSAAQGKALDEAKVNIADIVDNLTSTATDKPLSAAQGKALNDMMPKSATFSITPNASGLIPFTSISPTNIISAISNGYIILPCKNTTGAWRGLVTDTSLNVVTSQPTISVNVLYY